MLNREDLDSLRADFEAFKEKNNLCEDGSCVSGESIDLKDYPNYTDALYNIIMPPSKSGVYISRWDLKEIAEDAGESMAIHPRRRMFELLMKYAIDRERMKLVLDAIEKHILYKIEIYEELRDEFPHSSHLFQEKIDKANKIIDVFPDILDEYF